MRESRTRSNGTQILNVSPAVVVKRLVRFGALNFYGYLGCG